MRQQRINMVQTLDQYMFLYDCLLDALRYVYVRLKCQLAHTGNLSIRALGWRSVLASLVNYICLHISHSHELSIGVHVRRVKKRTHMTCKYAFSPSFFNGSLLTWTRPRLKIPLRLSDCQSVCDSVLLFYERQVSLEMRGKMCVVALAIHRSLVKNYLGRQYWSDRPSARLFARFLALHFFVSLTLSLPNSWERGIF